MRLNFTMEGIDDLAKTLGEMKKSTSAGVLRRVLLKAAQPVAVAAESAAPRGPTGNLKYSIGASTKLTRRQRQLLVKESPVEVYIGTSNPEGLWTEFGTYKQPPRPFLRPAFDVNKDAAIEIIRSELQIEIEKTVDRIAKKAAAKGSR